MQFMKKKYHTPSAEILNFYLEGRVAYIVGSQDGGDQWTKKREVEKTSSSSIWNNSVND